MKLVFHGDLIMVSHIRNILQANEIECEIRREYLAGGAGDLPLDQCLPELWVMRDQDADRAAMLIEENRTGSACGFSDWKCPACGEYIEGQFRQCWQCGTDCPEQ